MSAPWGCPLSCPQCGSDVRLVNSTSNGLLAVTVVACCDCNRQWSIEARVRSVSLTQAEINDRMKVSA